MDLVFAKSNCKTSKLFSHKTLKPPIIGATKQVTY